LVWLLWRRLCCSRICITLAVRIQRHCLFRF